MKGYQFEDTQGTFHLKKAENISYLYFPIAGEAGLKSSLTPNLGGDAHSRSCACAKGTFMLF